MKKSRVRINLGDQPRSRVRINGPSTPTTPSQKQEQSASRVRHSRPRRQD